MQASTLRGPYRATAARRAQIVRAAQAEFAAVGYDAASVRTIAARAGLSHAGLLHHFASKEDLLVAVLAASEADDRALLGEAVDVRSVDDVGELLRLALARYQGSPWLARLWLGLGATATTADHPHPAQGFVVRRYARWTDDLTALLDQVARTGSLSTEVTPRTGAVLLLGTVQGLMAHWLVDASLDVEAALAAALRALRR